MIVSNASTLILLAKSTLLEYWINHAGKIAIPLEVRDEAILGKEGYDARLIKKFIDDGTIVVQKVSEQKVRVVINEFRLDIGEAAAFALFDPKQCKAIMTDDAELIKLCRIEGVGFLGAMGIAVALYRAGALSKADTIGKIDKLYQIGRYSREIYNHFRGLVEGG